MGFIFGGGGGKEQAAATLKSAEMQAASDREVARAAVQSMQTQLAQKVAADKAAELLERPQKGANVVLAPQTEGGTVDPSTGKRRTRRDGFFSRNSGDTI